MPDNVSALQMLLTGDPVLLAIVRLSLLVSFSAVISPRASRRKPASLPSGRLANPEPLSRSTHSNSGSWLPPTIGGAGAWARAGRTRPATSQRSSAALGNSHLPVTLVHGTAPLATSSYSLRSERRR